ncbi:MAG: Clp1/GlmU family protein [Candidatus Bathyarchaeia archaeon]
MMNERTKELIPAGTYILVSGPASFKLISGKVLAVGAPIPEGRKILIYRGKQLPLEVLEDSAIEFLFGVGAGYLKLKENTIPRSWDEAIETVLQMENPKVMVIGDIDSGKSTFCTYLINKMIFRNMKPVIIDADIGQTDLGPPTTIGLGIAKDYILSLSSLSVEKSFFVGCTSPSSLEEKVIYGIKKLISTVHESQAPIIINTDGWILGEEAIAYKTVMATEISPDIVVGIAKDDELSLIMNSIKGNSIVIKASEMAKKRSKEERKIFRERKYWEHLRNARAFWLKIDDLEFYGLELKKGKILDKKELGEFSKILNLSVLYGEDLGKTINLWVKELPKNESFEKVINERKIKVIDALEKLNLIVGLLDENGFLKSFGILKGINFKGRSLKVHALYSDKIRGIDLGKVKLSKDGKELVH